MAKRGLNEQQLLFCAEYLKSFNAGEAAVLAGWADSSSIGSKLLSHPMIRAEIARRCRKAQKRIEVTGDDIRSFHASIVWDPRAPEEGGASRRDRISAAIELGKLLGLYTAKLQITGSLTLVDLLLAADGKTQQPTLPAAESRTH